MPPVTPSRAPLHPRDLARRRVEREWMDEPDLDPALHRGALEGLARLHRASGSQRIVANAIERALGPAPRGTLLDVACGRGDMLADLCRSPSWKMHGRGLDISQEAVRLATRTHGLRLRFATCDVLAPAPLPPADVVICTLFLHHLTDAQAAALLARMASSARRLLLVLDLERTLMNWWLIWAGARLLTRSPVVHVDSALSMHAAFTRKELAQLALRSGLRECVITRHTPGLMLLAWQPDGKSP